QGDSRGSHAGLVRAPLFLHRRGTQSLSNGKSFSRGGRKVQCPARHVARPDAERASQTPKTIFTGVVATSIGFRVKPATVNSTPTRAGSVNPGRVMVDVMRPAASSGPPKFWK